MKYINTDKVLGYLDCRIKFGVLLSAEEELKALATMIISIPPEKVREENTLRAKETNLNGRVTLYYCPSCKRIVNKGDTFCSKCGNHLLWQ